MYREVSVKEVSERYSITLFFSGEDHGMEKPIQRTNDPVQINHRLQLLMLFLHVYILSCFLLAKYIITLSLLMNLSNSTKTNPPIKIDYIKLFHSVVSFLLCHSLRKTNER
jgi:hypothetical protein